MRDLLTLVAGLLILVLAAALAVPPFIDWRGYRDAFDAAISRAAGAPVTTEGAIEVRLLPSPRLKVDRMRIGSPAREGTSLDAQFVRAEIALPPLMQGEVRFLASRVGRMEIRVPIGTGGEWSFPRTLVSDDTLKRAWVFEDLSVSQLLVTTHEAGTGRTDQAYAESVQLQAQSLAGPWRLAGRVAGADLTLATGPIEVDGVTSLKLTAEKPGQPRLTIDGRLRLRARPNEMLSPSLDGSARLVSLPGGKRLPFVASADFKTIGQVLELSGVSLEAGAAGSALRLSGSGQLNLEEPRLSLDIEGRRLDLDAMAETPAGEGAESPAWPELPLPIDLALKLESASFRGEEFSGLTMQGSLLGQSLEVQRLDLTAPGQIQVSASGTLGLGTGSGASGRVSLTSPAMDRVARLAGKLGFGAWPASAFDAKPVTASGDIVSAHPVTSLRNLRVMVGESSLSGAIRYTQPDQSGRPRLDGQLALQDMDLADLPLEAGLLRPARNFDLGFILDARAVGYRTRERNGRIAARFASEGDALGIERLEITNVAGANARLAGRIAADGAGLISGRLTAGKAGPLIDLAGRFWIGEPAKLLPPALREGPVDLAITLERAGSGAGAPSLSAKLNGSAANGTLQAEIISGEGRLTSLQAVLATERGGTLVRSVRPGVGPLPLRIEVRSVRDAAGRLATTADGMLAGVRMRTSRPVTLTADEATIESGSFEVSGADLAPLLQPNLAPTLGPIPVDLKAAFSRSAGVPHLRMEGSTAGATVQAELFGPTLDQLGGSVALGRLSLPWLAALYGIGGPQPSTAVWPDVAFGPPPSLPLGGTIAVKAQALDLGRGLAARSAEFTLSAGPDGLAVRDLAASLLDGSIAGEFRLNREGDLASLIGSGEVAGLPLAPFVGLSGLAGRFSADVRFGGSGQSVAALVGNLGGVGRVQFEGLRVPGADPGAVTRSAQRALRSEDPLNQVRLAAIAAEELGRGALAPGPVTVSASLANGTLRLAPLQAQAENATWQGSAVVDLRNMSLDARGALTPSSLPRGWTGAAPYLGLGWAGPLAKPVRNVDVGPLANGLAAVVLARELDRIETFELDAAERARINARVEMDRARRLAAEEAARLARQREEAERARVEAERILGAGSALPDTGGALRSNISPLPAPQRGPSAAGAAPGG